MIQDEVDKQSGNRGPGLSAVQKLLVQIRRRHKEEALETQSIDRPWSLGTLADYPMPPDVIPVLISIQHNRNPLPIEPLVKPLTIREALWISRLYPVAGLVKEVKDEGKMKKLFVMNPKDAERKKIQRLELWALCYAVFEWACDLADVPKDTSKFDIALAFHPFLFSLEWVRWMKDTDMMPKEHKKTMGEGWAADVERGLLGYELENIEMSGEAWWAYIEGIIFHESQEYFTRVNSNRHEGFLRKLRESRRQRFSEKEVEHERSHSQEI